MKRPPALMALSLSVLLAITGCAGAIRQSSPEATSAASPATDTDSASQQAPSATQATEDHPSSPTEEASESAEGLIDVPTAEKLMLAAVGADASIRTPDMIRAEPPRSRSGEHMARHGQACVDATSEMLAFDNAPEVELMTALVSDDSSINPIEPPTTEVLSIRAFPTEADLAQSDELNEEYLASCTNDSTRWEQSSSVHDGILMTVTTQVHVMDSSFFEDSAIVQDLTVNHGAMRVEYSTTPGSFTDAPLTTEEFLAAAGPRVTELVDGL